MGPKSRHLICNLTYSSGCILVELDVVIESLDGESSRIFRDREERAIITKS